MPTIESRAVRHQRQLEIFQTLVEVNAHPEDQMDAVFATWPQRVPKAVWSRMTSHQRQAWQGRRAEFIELHLSELFQESPLRLTQYLGVDVADHRAGIQAILALLQSLPGLNRVALFLRLPPVDEGDPHAEDRLLSNEWSAADLAQPPHQAELVEGLALALVYAGGLELVEELTLRVQRHDAHGQLVWRPQERCWGVGIEDGTVDLLSASAIRALCTLEDAAGRPVGVPPGVSFGDMRRHVQARGLMPMLRGAGLFTD